MAKTATMALLALALGGCATMQGTHEAATPPVQGAKLAEVAGAGFEPGKARLTNEGKAQVEQAVRLLQQHPDLKVSIEGHTDAQGRSKYNQTLSERRARAVADVAIEQGVAAERLAVRGFGETRPIGDNKTADGRSRNRRVEIVVQ